jgi:hypothetical protein
MAAQPKIVDLDALVGADIVVKIGGEDYKVPADIPAELFLRILHYSAEAEKEDTSDPEAEYKATKALRDSVLELFQIRQPELEELPGNMGLVRLVKAIGEIYGATGGEDPTSAQGQAGTKPRAGTKRQTKK